MHTFRPILGCILVFVFVGGTAGDGQEKKAQSVLTGLALEIITQKGAPADYLSVPGSSYGSNYPRLSPSSITTGLTAEQTALKIHDEIEGGAVRVKIYILRGKFRDSEVLVGSYLLTLGQRAIVEGLDAFGYQPIELRVVRLNSAAPATPLAISNAASVEVLDVVERQSNFPSYKVVLRNISPKDISQLVIKTYKAGTELTIQWEQKPQNRPVMKAGETIEAVIHSDGPGKEIQNVYTPSSPDKIEIATAVFADKSFEGEVLRAIWYNAKLAGQKIQSERVITLLDVSTISIADFRERADGLSREVAPEAVRAFLQTLPGQTTFRSEQVKGSIEAGLNDVRRELLKDIQDFLPVQSPDYDKWRLEMKQKYQSWFSRL